MALGSEVYVLGGYQTDFARNWTKENKHFSALMRESVQGALEACQIAPEEVQSAHVGNFAAELYCMQGHLGAFFTEVDPAFSGVPTGRHEAACASGSIAILAAAAEIEAGRYDLQAVVGIEQMKTVSADVGGSYLGTAAWYELEAKGVEFPFPKLFGKLGDEYDKRFGLKDEHLAEISKINYANAKLNPNAQTRSWYMNKDHALCRTEDNPAVGGRIRIADCSQVTDGAVTIFLASRDYAERWARGLGKKLADVPRTDVLAHERLMTRGEFVESLSGTLHADSIPNDVLRTASKLAPVIAWPTPSLSAALASVPGDVVIALSSDDFISFSIPFVPPPDGIFNRLNPTNPIRDWNMVYVPYCTGDIHGGDADTTQRFYREARAVAALDHPNIVRAYDIDQDEKINALVRGGLSWLGP